MGAVEEPKTKLEIKKILEHRIVGNPVTRLDTTGSQLAQLAAVNDTDDILVVSLTFSDIAVSINSNLFRFIQRFIAGFLVKPNH